MLDNLTAPRGGIMLRTNVLVFVDCVTIYLFRHRDGGVGRQGLDIILVKALLQKTILTNDRTMKAIITIMKPKTASSLFDAELFRWDAHAFCLGHCLRASDFDIVQRLRD